MTFDIGPLDAYDFPPEPEPPPVKQRRRRVQLSAAAKRAIRRRAEEGDELHQAQLDALRRRDREGT